MAVRKNVGLSQVDFAARVKTSARAYKNYELGLRDVPLSVIAAIHTEFGISFDWLILGKGAANDNVAENIIQTIVRGIKSFEEKQGHAFSSQKMETVFSYLFSQMANGRDFTEADIHNYLKSTI